MTPNLRYINQTAPFWDFVASMEDRAGEHPFFNRGGPTEGPPPPSYAWGWHHRGRGGMAHRGPSNAEAGATDSSDNAQEDTPMMGDPESKEKEDPIPDPPEDTPCHPGEGSGRRHGRCGGRRGFGHHHGPGAHGAHPRGGHHGRRHCGPPPAPGSFPFGGPHNGFPFGGHGGPRGFGFLADLFNPQANNGEDTSDFNPEADVFDTESAFIVHVSLPGAHKEDIGVSYDSEKSELLIAGVVHRPGDEAFLKTLALDERKVGAFERKVRLGTRTSPAQIDVEGISAKLENGILVVEVPKLNADFVEVKKVDIE